MLRERDRVVRSVAVAVPHGVELVRAVHHRAVPVQHVAGLVHVLAVEVLVGEEHPHLEPSLPGQAYGFLVRAGRPVHDDFRVVRQRFDEVPEVLPPYGTVELGEPGAYYAYALAHDGSVRCQYNWNPGSPKPRRAPFLPDESRFIIFRICWNWLSTWFTSEGAVPLPAAMRFRRLPLMRSG